MRLSALSYLSIFYTSLDLLPLSRHSTLQALCVGSDTLWSLPHLTSLSWQSAHTYFMDSASVSMRSLDQLKELEWEYKGGTDLIPCLSSLPPNLTRLTLWGSIIEPESLWGHLKRLTALAALGICSACDLPSTCHNMPMQLQAFELHTP